VRKKNIENRDASSLRHFVWFARQPSGRGPQEEGKAEETQRASATKLGSSPSSLLLLEGCYLSPIYMSSFKLNVHLTI